MSAEQLHVPPDSHESSDDKKKDKADSSPAPSRWRPIPLPRRSVEAATQPDHDARSLIARPMFEHIVAAPEINGNDKDDDDDEEEEDKVNEPADTTAKSVDASAEEPPVVPEQQAYEETASDLSDQELVDEWVLYPNQDASEQSPADMAEQDEEDADDAVAPLQAAGGGITPPPPPPPQSPPSPSSPPPPSGPGPMPNTARMGSWSPNWNMMPNQQHYNMAPVVPGVSIEQHRSAVADAEEEARARALRLGLVAGFVAGWATKAYLARKNQRRYEKEATKQFDENNQTIDGLRREQSNLKQQLNSQAEQLQARERVEQFAKSQPSRVEQTTQQPETPQTVQVPETEHIFDQEGNEIVLQPGWHVERGTGGYSVVLDERNRVVYDAIRYGEAFKRDQKREQVSDDAFGTNGSAAGPDEANAAQIGQMLVPRPSAQPDFSHELEPGASGAVDVQHRLPQPRNPIAAAVTSPWLWTAIAVLLIIYFLAALA